MGVFSSKFPQNLIFNPLNLHILNIFLVLTSSSIKILGKPVQGFLSYDRTNKQTEKQSLQLYIYLLLPEEKEKKFKENFKFF